jgi:hypothetical protein
VVDLNGRTRPDSLCRSARWPGPFKKKKKDGQGHGATLCVLLFFIFLLSLAAFSFFSLCGGSRFASWFLDLEHVLSQQTARLFSFLFQNTLYTQTFTCIYTHITSILVRTTPLRWWSFFFCVNSTAHEATEEGVPNEVLNSGREKEEAKVLSASTFLCPTLHNLTPLRLATSSVPSYKSLSLFLFIHFAIYLDIILYLDA